MLVIRLSSKHISSSLKYIFKVFSIENEVTVKKKKTERVKKKEENRNGYFSSVYCIR